MSDDWCLWFSCSIFHCCHYTVLRFCVLNVWTKRENAAPSVPFSKWNNNNVALVSKRRGLSGVGFVANCTVWQWCRRNEWKIRILVSLKTLATNIRFTTRLCRGSIGIVKNQSWNCCGYFRFGVPCAQISVSLQNVRVGICMNASPLRKLLHLLVVPPSTLQKYQLGHERSTIKVFEISRKSIPLISHKKLLNNFIFYKNRFNDFYKLLVSNSP